MKTLKKVAVTIHEESPILFIIVAPVILLVAFFILFLFVVAVLTVLGILPAAVDAQELGVSEDARLVYDIPSEHGLREKLQRILPTLRQNPGVVFAADSGQNELRLRLANRIEPEFYWHLVYRQVRPGRAERIFGAAFPWAMAAGLQVFSARTAGDEGAPPKALIISGQAVLGLAGVASLLDRGHDEVYVSRGWPKKRGGWKAKLLRYGLTPAVAATLMVAAHMRR